MANKPPICYSRTEEQPVCLPNNSTIWYKNTWNIVNWDLTGLLYIRYERLSLYFYYQENYNFYETLSFKNINRGNGYVSLLVNDSFFPSCVQDKKWNYSLLVLGNDTNPDDVINNRLSDFKRIDFNIIQNGTCTDKFNNSTIKNNTLTNSSNMNNNDNISVKMETWKIIVIVICCLLFIIISIILIRLIYIKKIIINKNIKSNKNEKNIITIDIKEKIYKKPDLKKSEMKLVCNKPDEFIKCEKPNCY